MKYTLPQRNAIIADIERVEKQINAEIRTACITAPTTDLVAILAVLQAGVDKIEAAQSVAF